MIACIKCGMRADECRIGVDVDTGDIRCDNCDECYTAADVRAAFAAWEPLLAWIEAKPAVPAAAEAA